jgi:hypothetical protein
MAISKKGMRPISVSEKRYHWKFTGKIFVSSDENSKGLLIVDFGWYDVFDYLGTKKEMPPDFEPKVATPKFVAESIKFAITIGWKDNKIELVYNKGVYSIKE